MAFKASPSSKHQHCTDEAQKAETVLSAVIYICIYIYIYIYIKFNLFFFTRGCFSRNILHVSKLLKFTIVLCTLFYQDSQKETNKSTEMKNTKVRNFMTLL